MRTIQFTEFFSLFAPLGSPLYHIRQTFGTLPGEAFYGLGQHQDGLLNYKGHRVDLFQNNTEVRQKGEDLVLRYSMMAGKKAIRIR